LTEPLRKIRLRERPGGIEKDKMILITALSIIGVVLNNYRNRACFIIWGFTNAIWATYDFRIGAWEQGILMTVYFCLAIWGWIQWGKE